jgi:two-component system, NarL family, nitrate/nitrite response regulator NarL
MSDVRPSGASPNRPTVVLMSDVRLYREGLARALAARDDVALTGDVPVTTGGIAQLTIFDPDIVLLEATAAKLREVITAIIASSPRSRVVAFAVADEEYDALRCTEAGAAGYVPRDASIDELSATIVRVSRGEFPCSPQVVALLARRLTSLAAHNQHRSDSSRVLSALLTAREREIIRLIDDGLSNKEISRQLGIGVSTVKNHVHHILDKTKATRRSQAAARMRRTSGSSSAAAT